MTELKDTFSITEPITKSKNLIISAFSYLVSRITGYIQSFYFRKHAKKKPEAERAIILTNYFANRYMPAKRKLRQKPITVENPETIWQFWDNKTGQKTPEIVFTSIDSVKKFVGNFDHKILNFSTIENYSDLPGYVFDRLKSGRMIYAHFADLLRLNLLKNHGGIWMDATLYATNFIPEYIINQDFFVFLTDKLTNYSYSYMQNFFIRAKKGSFLCEAWYLMCIEFWKSKKRSIDYFQHQLMFRSLVHKNPAARQLFNKMPHISEDETLQFVGNNLFKKFDPQEWERIKNHSFLQKTTYKVEDNKIISPIDYPDTFFSKLCEGIS